jgi:hypothetical protein
MLQDRIFYEISYVACNYWVGYLEKVSERYHLWVLFLGTFS